MGASSSRLLKVALPAALLVVFVAAWWLFAGSVNPLLFPTPPRVVESFGQLLASGEMVQAAMTTAGTFVIGVGTAVVVGIPLGLLVARNETLARIVTPYVTAIYATPVLVLVPFIIIWLGVGDFGRISLVFIGTVIPVYINAEAGFSHGRSDLVEVARSFGASQRDIDLHVNFPNALPFLMTGLRIGLGRGLISVVIAEIFLDLTGLGGLIQISVAYLQVDDMIAATLVLVAAGITIMVGMNLAEDRLAPWHRRV